MDALKQVNFRCEVGAWKAFVEICASQDTTASREVRRFIREVVRNHRQLSLETLAKQAAAK